MIKLIIGSTKISYHSPQSELDHRERLRAQASKYQKLGCMVNYYDEADKRFFYIPFVDETEAALFKLTHM
jgi:hypothetical protein